MKAPRAPRVLLVEDEPRIASMIGRALREAGLVVEVARDGTDALRRARARGHAGVVLDLHLPDMDGFLLLQTLVLERPHEPVVVVSALDRGDARDRCMALGASSYVSKPFALFDLAATVARRIDDDPPAHRVG